jgi:hypothetical protein
MVRKSVLVWSALLTSFALALAGAAVYMFMRNEPPSQPPVAALPPPKAVPVTPVPAVPLPAPSGPAVEPTVVPAPVKVDVPAPTAKSTERQKRDFAGKILLPSGEPASGAQVKLYYCHDLSGYGSGWIAETKSDGDGSFVLSRPSATVPCAGVTSIVGQYYLVAIVPGYAAGITEVGLGQEESYTVSLDQGREAQCTIMEGRSPIAGAEVILYPYSGAAATGSWGFSRNSAAGRGVMAVASQLYHAKSDSSGNVIISNAPSESCEVVVRHPAKGAGRGTVRDSGAGTTIRLTGKVWRVHGRVLDCATNAPLSGILVCGTNHSGLESRLTDVFPYALTSNKGEVSLTLYTPNVAQSSRGAEGSQTRATLVALDPAAQPKYAVAAATVVLQDNADTVQEFRLDRGRLLTGRVTQSGTGEVVEGVTVAVRLSSSDQNVSVYRRSDANGEYQIRVTGDSVSCGVVGPSPEYVLSDSQVFSHVRMRDEVVVADVRAALTPEAKVEFAVLKPDGTPAGTDIRVLASQQGSSGRSAQVSGRGSARIRGLAEDKEMRAYAYSANRSLAAAAILKPFKAGSTPRVEMRLCPTRAADFFLRDSQGNSVIGSVSVYLSNNTGDFLGMLTSITSPKQAGNKLLRVYGLLPDVEYAISARSADGKLTYRAQLPWRFTAAELNPRTTLTLLSRQEQPRTGARSVGGDFDKKVASLQNCDWQAEDPVEKHLTWYALKDGLALANSETEEFRHFTEVLGRKGLLPKAIAFGADKVWVGMNKGLYAYDRADGHWTRITPGGTLVDASVTELTLAPTGMLNVTAIGPNRTVRRFEYDTNTAKWKDLQ